jgi:tetraacyldisaccharide 4'-kinase
MRWLKRGLSYVWLFVRPIFAFPIALFYGLIIRLRNWLYDTGKLPIHTLPRPVISIGNLSLGGSGKTPFALYLIRWLEEQGIRTAYLSRGYGRSTRGYAEVDLQAPHPADLFGDEACMIKYNFPHLPVAVCEDRVLGGHKLIEAHPSIQVLVLDDAFQHRRLYRDLDILLIDVQRPPWKDWIFPLGRLREPLNSYRRAHLLIYNQKTSTQKPRMLRKPSLSFRYKAIQVLPAFKDLPPLSLSELKHKSAFAFCGIAHPESFYETLRENGIYLNRVLQFPDHHPFSPREARHIRRQFERLKRIMQLPHLLLLTTEKDLMRLLGTAALSELEGLPLYALRIHMEPVRPEEAVQLLHRLFGPLLTYDHARSI